MYRLIIALTLTLSATHGIAETMYQWTDDKGGRQFGQHPPADRAYQRVDIRAAPSPGAQIRSAAQPVTEKSEPAPADENASKREQEAKRQDTCAKLRENLVTLSNNPRLSRKNEAGEVERIGEEERQTMIAEAKQNLATYCQND
ncbi:protein of unknown function [Halopseudomonas xinjiangensis]|uniref:DUF4124 domain-containing protein n=1 Tax=Halopseudomonas xinjiangensis TaxID=487184 RepID=A0A1H1W4Z4_9GAMM|nr:DUF4124 domain-containing protein [Halopseudomonas xinjiangensis]SDS91576.1 protein of unknown function [Halopseudomonas xinjiangensis]